jgi:hypothetical protein
VFYHPPVGSYYTVNIIKVSELYII